MTAVGLLLPKNAIVGFTGGIAKEKLIHLLVVSANSRDSVERIRQSPSGESASRNFADGVCKIRSHEYADALRDGEARGLALHKRGTLIIILILANRMIRATSLAETANFYSLTNSWLGTSSSS
jgi:hypothetical protein